MRDFECIFDILSNLAEHSKPVAYQEFYDYHYPISACVKNLFHYNFIYLVSIDAIVSEERKGEKTFDEYPSEYLVRYYYKDTEQDPPKTKYVCCYNYQVYSLSWLGHNLKDFLSALKQQVSNDLNEINFYHPSLIETYGNTQVYKSLF